MNKYTLTYGVVDDYAKAVERNFYSKREAKVAYKLLKNLIKKEKRFVSLKGRITFVILSKNGKIIKKYM